MAKQHSSLDQRHQDFIGNQNIFFVATATEDSTINLSPKGIDTFKIINSKKVFWLNLTGSGNETAIHLQTNNRMTIMFCSFDKNPMILRLYGKANAHHQTEDTFHKFISLFPNLPGSRQIIEMDIDMVQTSCGYAIPFMEYIGERDTLILSSERKGKEGIKQYWKDKNRFSIDGLESTAFDKID